MAEVQLALQRGPAGFEKLVVVKLIHDNLSQQKPFVDMLLDEARVAALLKHPNVVDIYDLGEVNGKYFIAMEYLEGEPLLSVLRAGREGKRLDVHSTARLIADTAEGLDAAHELRTIAGDPIELVHHDVSLGNIVVLYNGQVKLVDFGVAKASQSATGEKNRVQGKFSYMAPEKLQGSAGDRRSDIWSLGVVLWEAITLKRLFRGGNEADTMHQVLEMPLQPPSTINGDVPPVFDGIVMRALARDPDDRYPTAKELADDLEHVLTQARYGAKNDPIARYMQDTFRDHIAARKKLLQEVATKGTASTEILDLAFSEPLIASGSAPGQNDFSVRFRRSSVEMPMGQDEPSQPRAITASHLAARSLKSSANMSTARPQPSTMSTARPSSPSTPPPTESLAQVLSFDDVTHAGSKALIEGQLEDKYAVRRDATPLPIADVVRRDQTPIPRVTSQRLQVISKPKTTTIEAVTLGTAQKASRAPVILIAVLLLAGGAAAVYFLLLRGKPAATPLSHTAIDAGAAPVATPDAPAASSGDIPMPSGSAAPGTEAPRPDEAEAQYRAGTKAFEKGDLVHALEQLKRAQQLDPKFAPTYRSLGLVYAKQGNKAEAKSALQRYLQLAPSAADAPQIRAKLDGL